MQHVWVAPHPGHFLAFAWFIENVTSPVFMALSMAVGTVSATDRWVFVVDPAASSEVLAGAQETFRSVGRRARRRYLLARISIGFLYAWPLVLLALGLPVSAAVGGSAGAGLEAATPATIAYILAGGAAALVTSWLARRSAREVRELNIEGVVRSGVLGRNREVLRVISRTDQLGLVEQRRFLDHLWRVAMADQARSHYLEVGAEFDEDDFAALRRNIETAEAALQHWTTAVRVLS
ncbi:hypothetical protein [Promicromonospora panici]|uniref:hypothetical protein n=1 Tax=Promicromonospora panici TaxID=2219658 RepID=UPI00101C2C51|nr:hypothetical protein [Promicromonospora panici]